MSSEDITPEQHPAGETRQVTVEVPAHRVAQFERFHQRFLQMASHWDGEAGNEDLREELRHQMGPAEVAGHDYWGWAR